MIYLDFAKAFDTVPHRRLMAKLLGYGISGKVWECIDDLLTDRKQCVIVNGETSGYEDVTSGISQGSVLGPLLVLSYINDLPDEVASLIKLFTDDTKLFTRIVTPQDCADLQKDLTALQDWSIKWLLHFNAVKCKVLRLGSGASPFQYSMLTKDVLTGLWRNLSARGTWVLWSAIS